MVWCNHAESLKFHGTSQVTSSKSDGNAEQTLNANARGVLICSRFKILRQTISPICMHLHQNAFKDIQRLRANQCCARSSIGELNTEPQDVSDSFYQSSMLPPSDPSGSNEWPFWMQLLCVGEELIPVCGNEFLLLNLRAKLLWTSADCACY